MELNLKLFFKSEQCKLAIELLKEQNAPVKPELIDRYNELLEKEQAEKENSTKELLPIYPHFCKKLCYSPELQSRIEETVEHLFAPVTDTNIDDIKKPGLLLGKIQSGKTKAFVGCMARAFDNGVDACIVLTKGTNALVEQTIQRLNHDFADCKRQVRPKKYPTVSIYDIMRKRYGLKASLINKEKNVFVAKKEDDNMRCLINVFHESALKDKKILIIDDEADFVSHSFKNEKKTIKEGVIAGLIDKLVEGLPNCRYLQVTATPYSLYLQPDEYVDLDDNHKVMPFRPRFTTILPTFPQYIGSQQYFVESANSNSMYSFLHHAVSPDCIARLSKKKKAPDGRRIQRGRLMNNVIGDKNIYDLRWAIMHYFVASAIRELQEERQTGETYHTSFIMHVGTNRDDHDWEVELIDELLDVWSEKLTEGSIDDCDFTALFDNIYDELCMSSKLGAAEFNVGGKVEVPAMPSNSDVLERVKEIILNDEYNVQPVNSDQDVNSLLDDDGQLELTHMLNLFIGGNVLDRGITIGHMLGFFYGREPQQKQQASMLQHCRMYGNRSKADMAVTRLYSQQTLYDALKHVNDMDDMMRAKFVDGINLPGWNPSIEFVYHDKEKGIVPCAASNIAISKITWWKRNSFVLPSGQQTYSDKKMETLVSEIGKHFEGHEERKCFYMDAEEAKAVVRLARKQFKYSGDFGNLDYKWDEEDMISLIDRLQKDGKIKAYTRKGCNTGRVRKDKRGFIDAPVDGQVESPYIKSEATDVPVLMMQLEKGNKTKGWQGCKFYWPVLCLPQQMENIAYCPRMPKSAMIFEKPLSEDDFSNTSVN